MQHIFEKWFGISDQCRSKALYQLYKVYTPIHYRRNCNQNVTICTKCQKSPEGIEKCLKI